MSGEQGLYEKYGFTKLGDFETIYGGMDRNNT
jgi:ribosomal protein S18 acetylase RimI-like enzyme